MLHIALVPRTRNGWIVMLGLVGFQFAWVWHLEGSDGGQASGQSLIVLVLSAPVIALVEAWRADIWKGGEPPLKVGWDQTADELTWHLRHGFRKPIAGRIEYGHPRTRTGAVGFLALAAVAGALTWPPSNWVGIPLVVVILEWTAVALAEAWHSDYWRSSPPPARLLPRQYVDYTVWYFRHRPRGRGRPAGHRGTVQPNVWPGGDSYGHDWIEPNTLRGAARANELSTGTAPQKAPSSASMQATRVWYPTHRVPAGGMPAWNVPDGSGPPAGRLPEYLDVAVVSGIGDWAQVGAVNGWRGWVDGRKLTKGRGPRSQTMETR